MDPKVVEFIRIGLRIFTFICLLITLAVIATDKLALIDGFKATFNDVHGYRYVLSVAAIGLAHTIFQLGFSIYHVLTQNIPFWRNGLPQFNYYADQVITWVLASAAGAGFAVSAELKRLIDSSIEKNYGDYGILIPPIDEQKSLVDDFFDQANISSAILFLGFLSMATLIILSPFKPTLTEARKLQSQSPLPQSMEPPSA